MRRFLFALLLIGLWVPPAAAQTSRTTARDLNEANECVVLDVSGYGTGTWDVRGTYSGTVSFTVSANILNYKAIDVAAPDTPDTAVNSTTSTGVWAGSVAGFTRMAACMTSYTSGTATVVLTASPTGGGGGAGGGGGSSFDGVLLDAAGGDPLTDTATNTLKVSASNLDVQIGGSDTVAVSNAGTFVVQENGAALTALQLLDNLVSVEDAPAGSAFSGIGMLAVRQDSQSALAADGEFIPPTIDSSGGLRVSIVSGAGSGGTALADDADFTAGTTSFTPIGGFYQTSVTACTDTDTCAVGITAQRTMKATLFTAAGSEITVATDWTIGSAIGTTGPGSMGEYKEFDGSALPTTTNVNTEGEALPFAASLQGVQYIYLTNEDGSQTPLVVEDAPETVANVLMGVGTVRRDTAASSAGTSGDNATLNTDATGRLWIAGALAEDAPHASGDVGLAVLSRRIDVAATSAGTDADYATLNTDATGLLWTRSLDPCSGVSKTVIPVNISTATTTELTPSLAGASTHYYVCAFHVVAGGAGALALADDDSDGCGSVTAGMAGGTTATTGYNFAANGGISLGNGSATVLKTNGTNRVICAVTSAAVQISGSIVVAAAP